MSYDTAFQIIRPLYRLAHARDEWQCTLRIFLTDALGFLKSFADPCVLFIDGYQTPSLLGAYVDDQIFIGGKDMPQRADRIAARFPAKTGIEPPFLFAGCRIEWKNGSLHLRQEDYSRQLSRLAADSGYNISGA